MEGGDRLRRERHPHLSRRAIRLAAGMAIRATGGLDGRVILKEQRSSAAAPQWEDLAVASTEQTFEVYPGIVVDARIMQGMPVIKGTRIPAQLIVGQMAGGESVEAIMEAYRLTQEQIRAALGYAADRLAAEAVYVVPTA